MKIERFGCILVLPRQADPQCVLAVLHSLDSMRQLSSFPWQTVLVGHTDQYSIWEKARLQSVGVHWCPVADSSGSRQKLARALETFSEEITHLGWWDLAQYPDAGTYLSLWGQLSEDSDAVHFAAASRGILGRVLRLLGTSIELKVCPAWIAPRAWWENLSAQFSTTSIVDGLIESVKRGQIETRRHVLPKTLGSDFQLSWWKRLRPALAR